MYFERINQKKHYQEPTEQDIHITKASRETRNQAELNFWVFKGKNFENINMSLKYLPVEPYAKTVALRPWTTPEITEDIHFV